MASAEPKKGLPIAPIIGVIVLIAAIAAWWFLIGNPQPGPVAKQAIDAILKADGSALKSLATTDSQDKVDLAVSQVSALTSKGLKAAAGDAKSVDVSGNEAHASFDVSLSSERMPVSITLPIKLTMARQGSFLHPAWKVDLNKPMMEAPAGLPAMPGMK
jgi:hypothetical protein